MKRSIKLTVKRISCLVMVCALLTSSYPIQTVAAETDVEETTPIAQADVQEEDDKEAVQNEAEQHSEAEEANQSSEVSKEKESVEDQTKTSKEEETTELTTEETGSEEETTTEEEITSEEETTTEEETTSEEETTTEETTADALGIAVYSADASLQISNVVLNDINLSYVSGKEGSSGYYEAEISGSAQAALQIDSTLVVDPDTDTDPDTDGDPDIDTDVDPNFLNPVKPEPISKSCTVKLVIKNDDDEVQTVDTQTLSLREGDDAQTISVSGTVKITQSGKYSVSIEVTGDDLSDTSKTKDIEVTVPEAISIKEFTPTSLNVTSVDKIMDEEECIGYKISYALKTDIALDGMDDKISLNDRKDEIEYSLERKQYTINSNRKKIAGGNYAQESIIDKLINSNGQSPDCMIEGDFTVNTAGEYQLQAVANKETVTSEAVTVEKLDQTAVFETQQDAFHFNEAVRYELTDGICIGNAKYFVSDEQGAAVRNSNVKITYDKNDKSYSIIVVNPKKDTTADVYFTVIYAGNNIYKEWKQTYKLSLTRKKAKITYTADKNNDPYKYCDKITYTIPKEYSLADVTCTEVDADGQPVRDKQLTISVNNYLLTKNITVINNNSDNKDKATTYLRFYYAGNDNYDADEQIITLNFAKEVQKVTYTYNKKDVYQFQEEIQFKRGNSEYYGTAKCYVTDENGDEVKNSPLTIKETNYGYVIADENTALQNKAQYNVTFEYTGDNSHLGKKETVQINFARLDNEVEYKPDCTQTSHEYGEAVTFKYEAGVDTDDITCYESDKDGKKIEDAKHLDIQKAGKDFIVKGQALSDGETPYYVTIKYAQNGVYKEASQTFAFGVHKINLHGDITVNEKKPSIILGKNKKLQVTVTMEADNDNLLKEDVDKINFTLVAFDGKEQTPLKATLSSKSLTENKKATYVYEIEQSSAHMLASGTKYTITATADYSKFTDPVYFESYSKIFDSMELTKATLGINVRDTLTVKYNHDNNKLYYEITGEKDEYIGKRPASCKIKVEDPAIIEIDDDGNFRTLMGGETTLTLTADDDSEYDIYETCTKTVKVKVESPENVDFTLNNMSLDEFLKSATKVGTENWYGENIELALGENNLYKEIAYSTDGGDSWIYVEARNMVINNTRPQNYIFYFCDRAKNISSHDIKNGQFTLDQIAVDTTNPSWNTQLSADENASTHSTESIDYFSKNVTLTGYTGEKQGSDISVDAGSGIKELVVQYGTSRKTETIPVSLEDRYKDAYSILLDENKIYGTISVKAIDYLGHESEVAEYGKRICVDKVVPIVGYVNIDQNDNEVQYTGEWTNQQLRYAISLLTGEQTSGIYQYQYAFIQAGSNISLDDVHWTDINKKDMKVVLGTILDRTQSTEEGTMQYGDKASESKVMAGITESARMNGTLYFRAESNAALTTHTEDIKKNSSRIKIWQQDLEVANVAATVAPDSSTGWYNKQTGPVSISFAYPEYDAKNCAPAAGIVYTFETKDENGNVSTNKRSFYRGILDEESGKIVEVSDYNDPNSLTSLESGIININSDSINELSVYVEDAAGNRSNITTYEIKADFIAPNQITATADGASMPVHLDASEGISYRVFSKSSISMSGQAQYGISEKKSFSMTLTKEQGGVSGSGAGTDSISIDPCNRGLVYICAIDGAGNKSEAWTDGVVSDNMIPTGDTSQEITITPRGKNEAEFYNKDVEVSVHVVDAPNNDNYAGLKSVTYTVGKDGNATQANVSMYSNEASVLSLDQIRSSQKYSDDKLIINATQNESNHAYIAVTATDHAGNTVTTTKELKIDVTKPEIEISFDTDAAQNERYYNTNRVARIDIKELNFDPNQVTFRIYKDGVEDPSLTPAASSWSTNENSITHTSYITFAEDGDYSFEVECTDLAGNDSEIAKTDTFTIDKTKPVVEVSYDNNQAWKENYYNQARTATISITEHNFDEKDFQASITPQASVGGWTHNGDVHKITIHFNQDEHYTYSVNYTDLAGNTIDTFTPEEFYIDSNAPTIEINGVADHSANAGDVNPTVTVADNNYDAEGVKITLQNSKGQQIELKRSQTGSESGYTYALTNVNEQPDEIYTLAVVATDKAGNESELSYRFALNRHGSVYDLSQISSLVDRAYIRYEDLEDLHIQEMNVSEVDDFEVYVTRNGEMVQSKQQNGRPSSNDKNTIYVGTQVNGSDEIGYEYDYTLYRESFQQEGIYNIMFYSKDAAGNEVNNTLTEKKADLTFIIDNTAPTVVIEGVEDGQLYVEESKDVNVYVSDNFKLTEAYFTLVDEEGNVVETYNYMDMAKEAGDIVTLTLPSSDKKQSLRYYAADAAGNSIVTLEDENTATGFTISTNAWLRYTNDKKAIAATIATAAAVIMAGIGIVIFKKKKVNNNPAAAK